MSVNQATSALRRIAVYALLIPALPFAIIPSWAHHFASRIDRCAADAIIESAIIRGILGDA